MKRALPTAPVVHLELRTGDLSRACAFYTRLFGWQTQTVDVGASSYVELSLGFRIEGGVVENESEGARRRGLDLLEHGLADVSEPELCRALSEMTVPT
jgi:predicted enzyme related to lactoylglutathione lyase